METKSIRQVICDRCGKKYAFVVPLKTGVYRIQCPQCCKEVKFKVINDK